VYMALGQANPAVWQLAGDLIFKAMDLPYSDKIAERLKMMLPPQIQQMESQGKQLPPEAQAAMAQAEQAMARGEIRVVPPTLLTLEDLAESHARHGGLAGMLAAERDRAAPPVMPRIDVRADEFRVVMPWDPGYGEVSGAGCQPAGGFPPHLLRRRSCLAVARDREAR